MCAQLSMTVLCKGEAPRSTFGDLVFLLLHKGGGWFERVSWCVLPNMHSVHTQCKNITTHCPLMIHRSNGETLLVAAQGLGVHTKPGSPHTNIIRLRTHGARKPTYEYVGTQISVHGTQASALWRHSTGE